MAKKNFRSSLTKRCKTCGTSFNPWMGREETSNYCTRACAYADEDRMPKRPPLERFWELVDRRGPDDCWPWLGRPCHEFGYGGFYLDGRSTSAHRASYILNKGPIPRGLCVCHSCDNPGCVNPEHLFAGPQLANVRDMDAKGRRKIGGATKLVGSLHPRSKLVAEQVLQIRADTRPGRLVAAEFGVSQSLVQSIRNGRTWKHI